MWCQLHVVYEGEIIYPWNALPVQISQVLSCLLWLTATIDRHCSCKNECLSLQLQKWVSITAAAEISVCHCSCNMRTYRCSWNEGLSLQLQGWGSVAAAAQMRDCHCNCRVDRRTVATEMRVCHCSCRDEGLLLQLQIWEPVTAAAEMRDCHCSCRDVGLSSQL